MSDQTQQLEPEEPVSSRPPHGSNAIRGGLIILTLIVGMPWIVSILFGMGRLESVFAALMAIIAILVVLLTEDKQWTMEVLRGLAKRLENLGGLGKRIAGLLYGIATRMKDSIRGHVLVIVIFLLISMVFAIWNVYLSFSYHNTGLIFSFVCLCILNLAACIWVVISIIRAKGLQETEQYQPENTGQSPLNLGTGSTSHVVTSKSSKLPNTDVLNGPIEPLDAIVPPEKTSPQRGRRWQIGRKQGALLLSLMILVFSCLGNFSIYNFADACHSTPAPGSSSSFGGVVYESECIGLSNGTIIFDTGPGRTDEDIRLKREAAQALRNGDSILAQTRFNDAVSHDPTDAEALIYREDIGARKTFHITLIVNAILSGLYFKDGRDTLQGVYIAQNEYNKYCLSITAHCPLLNIVIANTGSGTSDESAYAQVVAGWILQAAQKDPTIVGVVDGLASQSALKINDTLSDHPPLVLPMVAARATSDFLNPAPHFLRIVPPNSEQAQSAAHYALHILHAKKVAIFYRGENAFSGNLKDEFQKSFSGNDLNKIVNVKNYPARNKSVLKDQLRDVLQSHPDLDLLYCACYTDEVSALLESLPETKSTAHLKILGGDALSDLGDFTSSSLPHLSHVLFTALAYPNSGQLFASGFTGNKNFFRLYGALFDPTVAHPETATGFQNLTAGVMQSYDAAHAFTRACEEVCQKCPPNTCSANKPPISSNVLEQRLFTTGWDGTDPKGGVTGALSFATSGNPVHKAVYLLSFSKNTANDSALRCERIYGQFLVTQQSPPLEEGQPCSF